MGVTDRPADRGPDRAHSPGAPLSEAGRALHDRFVAALDDDLDLPVALAVVREMLRAAGLSADERRWLTLDADAVLGLDLHLVWGRTDHVPADIQRLVTERDTARAARDFQRADALRDEAASAGWHIVDDPTGSTVRRQ